MAPSQRLQELFDLYLRRAISPAEVEELVLLLGQADAEETLSGPMHKLWEDLKARPMEHPVDWDRMYRQISLVEEDLSTLNRRRSGLLRRIEWDRIRWGAVAATFLLLAVTAAYWSIEMRGHPGSKVAGNGVPAGGSSGDQPAGGAGGRAEGVVHGQTAENKKVIHLPDGSMVILNKQSTLDYKAAGTTGAREVTLTGEAYFDVVHQPDRPFVVHTGKIETRVLGTDFNIKAYPTEKSIEVTVDHGKVQVLKGGSSMGLLSDKEQIRFDRGTESYLSEKVNLKPVIAWKPVEISFDDITMAEATRRIGERFHASVSFVNPALKGCRVTATFYMEDDLDQIMTVICGVNQSNFVIRGDTITIDGKGCN